MLHYAYFDVDTTDDHQTLTSSSIDSEQTDGR